ncbi:MAG TPA: hypothetical protein VLT51_11805 [Anaerolineales bacterium]|nr:hypothetical protein [Anaerolineales bacterium]
MEIDDDFPEIVDEIRTTASVLVLLGHIYVWLVDEMKQHLRLAISRLEEILSKELSGGCDKQIQAEVALLISRLDHPAENHVGKAKWWHLDECI